MLRKKAFCLLPSILKPKLTYCGLFSFATLSKSYYQILGVPQSASQAEIKAAYYKLAKQHHPDVTKGSDDKFKEINSAYETLSDTSKKQKYDQDLKYNYTTQNSYSSGRQSYSQQTSYQQQQWRNYQQQQSNSGYYYDQNSKTYKRRAQYNNHYDFYSNYKRSYYEDFDAATKEEPKNQARKEQYEWSAAQAEQELERVRKIAMQTLKERLVAFLAIAFTFFVLLAIRRKNLPKNYAIYDPKTNNVYVTDEHTFKEWARFKNAKDYQFQNDPRFVKQVRARSSSTNPSQVDQLSQRVAI